MCSSDLVLTVSARTGDGLEEWFASIANAEQAGGAAMPVDYEIYAEGEALLGWLNCTVALRSTADFDANAVLRHIAQRAQERLNSQHAEIAHLKMTLSSSESLGGLAVINLVRNDYVPELSQELPESVTTGQLIINCRAEAAPEALLEAVRTALDETAARFPGITLALEHSEHFRPGKPQPTHRDTVMA